MIRDGVVVLSGYGIVRMTPFRGIGDGSDTFFLHSVVCECFPVAMLTVPYSSGFPIFETDHIVFPVSDVIAEFLKENGVAEVVGIEVHVEGIDETGAMVVDYYCTACCALRLSGGVRDSSI